MSMFYPDLILKGSHCSIMREEQNSNSQKFMLDHLFSLLDDANDFSSDAAKTSHAMLLCCMEQGEITSYQEMDKIDRVRRANAQRHVTVTQHNVQNLARKKIASKTTNSMPCVHLKCHDTKGTFYTRICVCYFATTGKTFPNPESECRNKQKNNAKREHGCLYSNPCPWQSEQV